MNLEEGARIRLLKHDNPSVINYNKVYSGQTGVVVSSYDNGFFADFDNPAVRQDQERHAPCRAAMNDRPYWFFGNLEAVVLTTEEGI